MYSSYNSTAAKVRYIVPSLNPGHVYVQMCVMYSTVETTYAELSTMVCAYCTLHARLRAFSREGIWL